MKTRNEGSAWVVIFKIAASFVLFCLIPLVTLKSEAIDRYCESVEGQKVIFLVVISGIGSYGIVWFWNRIKRKLKEG